MSLVECKETIAALSMEERLEIAAFIAHLNRCDDSEYQDQLDGRMSAMDAGHKTSSQTLQNLHDDLSRQGR